MSKSSLLLPSPSPLPTSYALASCALAASLLAGCLAEEPALSGAELEIVNGVPTGAYPSVVRVFAAGVTNPDPTTPSCTGVLITHSSVLTAAHCVTAGAVHLTDLFSGTAVVHPTLDLAVISTLDKVGRPFHARMNSGISAPLPITLVGFGQTDASTPQDGIKRMGTNTIDSFDGTYFYYDTDLITPAPQEAATCFGDSGGPAFVGTTDCVVGATKGQTSAPACSAAGGAWYHSRTDIALAWLESVTRDSLVLCGAK